MKKLKIKSSKNNEKGVALVFTLLFLSLLLILALGFALSSMFNEKAADNAANASSAGFLAQTQLKQILSLIQNDEANLENSKCYSHDSGSPAVTNANMLKDMLKERLPVSDLLTQADVDTDKVNWNYIRSKDTAQSIIGRTAFVVIADGIPLNSLVDGRAGTTEYPKHSEEFDTETRIGKYLSEINVRAAMPSATSAISAISDALNWKGDSAVATVPGFDNGKYTGCWESFSSLFSIINVAINPASLTVAQKGEMEKNLSLTVFNDKEAFWADIEPAGAPDGEISSNELYKRFDLTRNWETADNAADLVFLRDKILLDPGKTGAPTEDMEKWGDADSGSASKGLPWLAAFGYKADGTGLDTGLKGSFGSVYDRRCQIAANLKDYCDRDKNSSGNYVDIDGDPIIRPTSDVDPANWIATEPKFTGNEKTPYINKVGFKVTAVLSTTAITPATSPPTSDVRVDVSVTPCVELIYIYQDSWTDAVDVTIEGSVKIKTTNGGTAQTKTYSLNTTINVNGFTNGYSNLTISAAPSDTKISDTVERETTNVTIQIISFQIDKVVLHSTDVAKDGYDYTKLLTGANFTTFTVDDPVVPQAAWFGFAVHDPRHNLHSSEWQELTPKAMAAATAPENVFSLAGFVGKPNAENSSNTSGVDTESPSVGVDKETINDPVKMSTAFMRNGPMESPWELGFIHRGARWQTINLKKYAPTKAFGVIKIGTAPNEKQYIPGGGAYADGDANILDQIKMTKKGRSPQKTSLKSQNIKVFEALFSKIKYGCVIDSNMSVGSMATGSSPPVPELSSAQITSYGNNIIAKYKPATGDIRTRASVVDQLVPPVVTTDAKQEELIGKIINLTEVGGKVGGFTIIILAQTIKDVGTSSGITIHKYSDDETPGSRLCKTSVFDAAIDLANPKKSIYYDEITAEQKIIVKGCRANDGSIKITSFQYVD
jgi:hypothetical protein